MFLLEAIANAPVCAVSKRWPRLLHAAERQAISSAATSTVTAACGTRRLRLLTHDGHPVLFPPGADAAPIPRCPACWVATGRRRPRQGRKLTGRRE